VTAGPEGGRATLLCHAPWPSLDFADDAAAADVGWLVELVSEVRSVRTELNVPPGTEARLVAVQPDAATADRLRAHDASLRRMARLSAVDAADGMPGAAAQIVVGGQVFALPLEGMIDVPAERERLTKAVAKGEAEIERSEKKLSNERFVASAPPSVVAEEREKLESYRAERDKLAAALKRLEDIAR
jgi:valyl-tRNA synthetase